MIFYNPPDSTSKVELIDPSFINPNTGEKEIGLTLITKIEGKKVYLYDHGKHAVMMDPSDLPLGASIIDEEGTIKFTQNVENWQIPKRYGIKSVDVFCVGGGGGGGISNVLSTPLRNGGEGGGGGYTTTVINQPLEKNIPVKIIIGIGGAGGYWQGSGRDGIFHGPTDGGSSIFYNGTEIICSASGGQGRGYFKQGGAGGSGGGGGQSSGIIGETGGEGGINGAGGNSTYYRTSSGGYYHCSSGGGGQGITTRLFNIDKPEFPGPFSAGGNGCLGGGSRYSPNSGNGGKGGYTSGESGSSGVVFARFWRRMNRPDDYLKY